ncbi:MAG: hypothetical protein V7603_550 [Micromonosporaceae bacterium]
MLDTAVDRRAATLGRLIATEHPHLVDPHRAFHAGQVELGRLLGSCDPDLGRAMEVELRQVFGDGPMVAVDEKPHGETAAEHLARRLADHPHALDALWALLGGDDRLGEAEPDTVEAARTAGTGRWRTNLGDGWLARQRAALVMNLIVLAIGACALRLGPPLPVPLLALKGFGLWCLAFLPCWLYIRFLGQRAGALWDEYVLNLHRLGWDHPRFLPRPPRTSQFYDEWIVDGGRTQTQDRNIYRQKFNAYYGRSVAANAREENFRVRLDTLFPVFLTAAVLSVCWAAVLWDDRFLRAPAGAWDMVKFGYLGAYVFIVQMLLRRFFGSDLRPSAYTGALLRITVVLVSVASMYQLLEIWFAGSGTLPRWEAVAAFTIGFLPLVATQVVLRAAATPLRAATPALESDYPLSQLDGLNIWYEARLVEENIEDMQNLATANFVDVILHTRVPVGRLVDWVDQAFLFLHLDRIEHGRRENRRAHRRPEREGKVETAAPPPVPGTAGLLGSSVGPASRGGTHTRTVLRQLGVRTATDLIRAFPPDLIDPSTSDDAGAAAELRAMLLREGVNPNQIRMLVRVLSEEPGLAPLWNWYDQGVSPRCARRLPRSVPTR